MKDSLYTVLNRILPPEEYVPCRCEVDYYGAAAEIARRLGLDDVPYSYGGWLHGWNYISLCRPEQLLLCYDPKRFYLVWRQEEADFLQSAGIRNVKAAGMPFLYAERPEGVRRHPGTLLVMPAHSALNTPNRPIGYTERDYVDFIVSHRKYFDEIVFCIHRHDATVGYWLKELKQAGIPYITGAGAEDRNSFRRLLTIFGSVEYMTSNVIGSHVLYAAHCGVKVSISDAFNYVATQTSDKHMKTLNPLFEQEMHIDKMRGRHSQFYTEPHLASLQTDWAAGEAGIQSMLAPEEIASLFRWSDPAVQRFGHYSARLAQTRRGEYLKRIRLHLLKRIAQYGIRSIGS